jgi:hypothetical protein
VKIEIERDGEKLTRELRPIRHPESIDPKIGVSLSDEIEADSNVIKALSPACLPGKWDCRQGTG